MALEADSSVLVLNHRRASARVAFIVRAVNQLIDRMALPSLDPSNLNAVPLK
jgi:hypothetical protein